MGNTSFVIDESEICLTLLLVKHGFCHTNLYRVWSMTHPTGASSETCTNFGHELHQQLCSLRCIHDGTC